MFTVVHNRAGISGIAPSCSFECGDSLILIFTSRLCPVLSLATILTTVHRWPVLCTCSAMWIMHYIWYLYSCCLCVVKAHLQLTPQWQHGGRVLTLLGSPRPGALLPAFLPLPLALGACLPAPPLEVVIGRLPMAPEWEVALPTRCRGGCPGCKNTDFMAEYTSSAVERTTSLL